MVSTEQMQNVHYIEAVKSFVSGEIYSKDKQKLQVYLAAIAQNATGDDAVQARDIVQSLTINHLLLQQHINELEKKGRITQVIVITLTIGALVFGAPQLWFAYKADKRAEQETKKSIHVLSSEPTAPSAPNPSFKRDCGLALKK